MYRIFVAMPALPRLKAAPVVPLLAADEDLEQLIRDPATIVKRIKEKRVEVVLLDLKLLPSGSSKDGLEILKDIKRQNKETKVIVLTGFHEDENIDRALEIGADGYLLKSHTHLQRLRNKIKDVLTRRRLLIVDDEP